MEILTTEEQQIAAIRQWWKDNGGSVVTGVVLGLALLFAGKAWFGYQERNAQDASNIYSTMMNALQAGDTLNAGEKAGLLLSDYGKTPYAQLAALALARMRVDEGQLDAARAQLQWVLDNGSGGPLRDIARLRLARVLIASGELDGAWALAGQPASAAAFDVLMTEVRGDIQRARGDLAAASESYGQALADTPDGSQGKALLQLKYTDTLAAASGAAERTQ